ncbi:MAG: TlpA family protein disulfide reductase [Bdellovibrionota bacterium]
MIIPIVMIIGLVVGTLTVIKTRFGGARPHDGPSAFEVREGSTVPDLTLQKYPNGETTLSQLSGKVVLINFWATWCEACMEEMPSILKLRGRFKDRGFEVVAVNVDENPEAVLPATLKQLGIDFPVYIDKEGQVAGLFDVHAIPLTVMINSSRKVLLVQDGERNWMDEDLLSKMEKWLSSS